MVAQSRRKGLFEETPPAGRSFTFTDKLPLKAKPLIESKGLRSASPRWIDRKRTAHPCQCTRSNLPQNLYRYTSYTSKQAETKSTLTIQR